MSIKTKIKSLFNKTTYIEHIVDKVTYPDILTSHAGGSLATSNLLIVTNGSIDDNLINDYLAIEQVNYHVLLTKDLLNNTDLVKAGDSLIGPFTHVINFYYPEKETSSLNPDNNYTDSFYMLYQWQQKEVDYLVNLSQYSTICTCYIYDNSINGYVGKRHAEMCIKGLAAVLSNHGMICNGIVASRGVPFDTLLKSSIFMSSKYGQIMSGEVLDLTI